MMRITLESPALIASRSWLAGKGRTSQRSGRSGSRVRGSRTRFQAEQLEPRTMLDGTSKTVMVAAAPTSRMRVTPGLQPQTTSPMTGPPP